jgi:hypothetical protein
MSVDDTALQVRQCEAAQLDSWLGVDKVVTNHNTALPADPADTRPDRGHVRRPL